MRSVARRSAIDPDESTRSMAIVANCDRPVETRHDPVVAFVQLAVSALFVSGGFVLLVAISRTPLVALVVSRGYLQTALVGHVTFALNVWLLSSGAALWVDTVARLAPRCPRPLLRPGASLVRAGIVSMAVVPLVGAGPPILTDYVPFLGHSVFLLGMGTFATGVALVALNTLRIVWRHRRSLPAAAIMVALAAAAYLAAVGVLGLAIARGGTTDPAVLAWDAGHALQVTNAASLVAASLLLAPPIGSVSSRIVVSSSVGFVSALAMVVGAVASGTPWEPFGTVFWTSVGFPTAVGMTVALVSTLGGIKRTGQSPRPEFVVIAAALLGAGGLIALLGLGNDTRVTAHYHGVVGSVTVVFMGLIYRFLEERSAGPRWRPLARIQPYLYGGGLLLVITGLFFAGEAGTARKVFEAISTNQALVVPAMLFGLGALVTIVAGLIFVVTAGISLVRLSLVSSGSPANVGRRPAVPGTGKATGI